MSIIFNKLIFVFSLILLVAGLTIVGAEAQASDSRFYHGRGYANTYGGPLLYGDGYGNTYIFYRGRRYPTRTRGSNDWMYQRDNIYGHGASAAGRMSHFTLNVPRRGF